MRLIAWAVQGRDDLPLLVAANRDDAWDRPTLPLRRWTDHGGTPFWAGQDARDGDTWMGFGEGGRLAFLANVREANMPATPRSRGELVTRWLASHISVQQLQAKLNPADYGGFNLVLGDWRGGPWHRCSNRDPADPHRWRSAHAPVGWHTQAVASGLGSLSNASLNTPWPSPSRTHRPNSRKPWPTATPALPGPTPACHPRPNSSCHRPLCTGLRDATAPAARWWPLCAALAADSNWCCRSGHTMLMVQHQCGAHWLTRNTASPDAECPPQ